VCWRLRKDDGVEKIEKMLSYRNSSKNSLSGFQE
jgi:hypothetical protein